MSERIIIQIDDEALDEALGKFVALEQVSRKTTGQSDASKGLPTINREMRLILGRIPGMRQAIAVYFRLKRLQRGLTTGPDLIASLSTFQGMLVIVATLTLIVEFLARRQDRFEQEQRRLELFIRRERGINEEQFQVLLKEWQTSFRGLP